MASGPITSWQIEGGKMEAVTESLFLGSKITADCDCSHEIILELYIIELLIIIELYKSIILGRKAMTNLDQRHHFPTKFHIVLAIVLPIVIWL